MNQICDGKLSCENSRKIRREKIDVSVSEMILTPLTCASVVNEIIKCLVYQKSQIPYPYNWLKSVINKKRNEPEKVKPFNLTVERHYEVVSSAYDALENIIQNVNAEFKNYGDTIKQVLILFGSTLYSPKEVYTICLNGLAKGHLEDNHLSSNNRNQHKVLRNIILAEEWISAMESSIPPTNMYVLLQKNSNCIQAIKQGFFVPNKQYSESTRSINMKINLCYNENVQHNCCNGLLVFEDLPTGRTINTPTVDNKDDDLCDLSTNDCDNSDCNLLWFQASVVLKGFKQCFIKDVSATELW